MVAGVAVALLVGTKDRWPYAPAIGWITAAAIYLLWTWRLLWNMNAAQTEQHAKFHEKDGNTHTAHYIVLVAALASLGGVGYLLSATSGAKLDRAAAVVGILSVMASWFAIHTIFMLRYAGLYYGASDERPINFSPKNDPPWYQDFAYVAFTLGMTYQVSDTELIGRKARMTALLQAMVSFLIGAIILAITINLVASLAS